MDEHAYEAQMLSRAAALFAAPEAEQLIGEILGNFRNRSLNAIRDPTITPHQTVMHAAYLGFISDFETALDSLKDELHARSSARPDDGTPTELDDPFDF